jgi:adenosylcobinamide-phosphate synthase
MSPLALIPLGLDISRNKKPQKGAFQFLAQSLQQNLIPSDHHGLRRNIITLVSIAYIHWIIGPIIIYIMAGIYGAYAYFGLTILIKSIPNPAGVFSYIPFAIFIIIERALSFLGLVLLCLTSVFSPATRIGFALKGLGYKEKMTEAGFAFTHSIVLGGPIHNRHGDTVSNEWIGASGATAKLQHKDCVRVIIHYSIALFVFVSILLALMLYAS